VTVYTPSTLSIQHCLWALNSVPLIRKLPHRVKRHFQII